jgi:CRISPR-associated protein Cas1
MFLDPDIACFAESSSGSDWAERGEHWIEVQASFKPKRRVRHRNSLPLILCGHGVSLRVENGALVIRDGFTHYPQEQARYRFFAGGLDIPPRILLLDGSGTLSFDVLSWLADQDVALARVKWTGEVAAVASGTGYASDADKVRWQRETRLDEPVRLAFAIDLVRRKLVNSILTLEESFAQSISGAAIGRVKLCIERLASCDLADMAALRAIEAEAASAYFAAWRGMALQWKDTARRPVPENWQEFSSRSSLANGHKLKNCNASHPMNAMLNYAYTVKQAHLHIQAVADGFDPTIGIMHHGRRGLAAYVFDLIEPERPKVDAAILGFVQSRKFAAADFIIRSDGVCRLSPQLARAVVGLISA